jgi:hypothetical protein
MKWERIRVEILTPYVAHLENKIDSTIVNLTDSEGQNYWDRLDKKQFTYFLNNIIDTPWANHLVLNTLCLYARNLTVNSIYNLVSTVNNRLILIFEEAQIDSMDDFNFGLVEKYMTGIIAPSHSDRQRLMFLTAYNSLVFNMSKWVFTNFHQGISKKLEQYVLPKMPFDNRDFSVREKAISTAKTSRKSETSAITPLLPQVRAEGYFRWNQLKRLRELVRSLIEDNVCLPYKFSYDESEYTNERWTFVLWDKESFNDTYKVNSSTGNLFFLEFVGAVNIDTNEKGEGLWFLDILKYRLIGLWDGEHLTKTERKERIEFLRTWGYEEADKGQAPFVSRNKGLLTQSVYVVRNGRKFEKTLINLEPLYAACTFAKFALDICTSTGARMNELLQISFDKQCCVKIVNTKHDPPINNFIFRLIPKGRDEEENYYVPEEAFKFMQELLEVIRSAEGQNELVKVEYNVTSRKETMPPKKYLFQYQGEHINQFTMSSIIRFLLHGIIVETSAGKQVVVKTHLLRHAFATHASQVEKLPIDIVKVLMHQKDIDVTSYYSAPTEQQVSESITTLHESWLTQIDIQKGLIRTPQEIQEMYEEYTEKVGTHAKVLGGICTTDSICPSRFSCIGCASKIPQPEFKNDLLDYIKWVDERERAYSQKGLMLEAKKMKITKKRAQDELKEIHLIERVINDERHVLSIRKEN